MISKLIYNQLAKQDEDDTDTKSFKTTPFVKKLCAETPSKYFIPPQTQAALQA